MSKEIFESAFALVDPSKRPTSPGMSPLSWKDRIASLLSDAQLQAAGVTIEQVNASIEFFTATKPLTTREKLAPNGEHGYLVLADGYRAGPAGDH